MNIENLENPGNKPKKVKIEKIEKESFISFRVSEKPTTLSGFVSKRLAPKQSVLQALKSNE